MSPGINTARPPWGRDPTMRTSRRDVAGYRHSTASLAQGPQHDEESRPASVRRRLLRSRLGIKHGRRGAGTPRCGEADEMSPGIGTARPRWRRDPSMTRRADQGLFVGDSLRSRLGIKHGRRGAGAPRCGGGDEMSPGKNTARPPWGRDPTMRRRQRDVAGK